MKRLARLLKACLDKLQAAKFSKDRAEALVEAYPVMQKCISAMENAEVKTQVSLADHEFVLFVDRLLASVAPNRKVKVGCYHITDDQEFTTAIRGLMKFRGEVEVISLSSNPRVK